MVQLIEEQAVATDTNSNHHDSDHIKQNGATKHSASDSASDSHNDNHNDRNDEIDIDYDLIDETRKLVREAYEDEQEGGGDVYSRAHYEQIMDPKAPMTCWRYLVHCRRVATEAADLMKRALVWRKQEAIDELGPKDLAKDLFLKAPCGWTGRSSDGHDVVYIIGKNYRKPDSSVKHLVRRFITFTLLEFDRRHKDDLEQFIAVFDVSETTYSNMDLDFIGWLISVRDYFPHRFKAINVVGIPFLIRPIIKLIISWLPEAYKQITHCGTFEQLVKSNVDDDQLPYEVGGTADDTWRLAPRGAPWAADSAEYTRDVMDHLERAICFNIPQERLDKVIQMQVDFDAKQDKATQ